MVVEAGRGAALRNSAVQRDLAIRAVGRWLGLTLTPIFAYAFLWLPILVLLVFSFNESKSVSRLSGLSLGWYEGIFANVIGTGADFSTDEMLESFQNSLFIAGISTFVSTVIGTMVALALVRGRFPGKRILDGLLYFPLVIPEITQGVSLLLFFSILAKWWRAMSGQVIQRGYGTVIIAHVAFSISFVALVVRARLVDMNPNYEEAARDLGANEWRTFWRITFPLILPGVLAGALLAFTISLDDFVVTFFTRGAGFDTLPIYVFGLLKLSPTPAINAISTLMLVLSSLLVGVSLALQGREARTIR
ncbi:MAG: ABC transporter permease [Anaerolineaceae bacterium]|nr:ABC transporter permease [Anaerolineaceae bacterium]MCY3936412.1 ABC transporter permease [Chloroflexota bacterium]MCY4008174.1 ABC transporter permease [Anaerolineaceae bacterium]MCY4105171.1 ABC transporter permease [Chloroflexota bacterium]